MMGEQPGTAKRHRQGKDGRDGGHHRLAFDLHVPQRRLGWPAGGVYPHPDWRAGWGICR
jgi:hypothetical protein